MTQNTFLSAVATWAGDLAGINHAAVYQSDKDWQTGDGDGYGGLEFDVPAVFVHAFGMRPTKFYAATDYDMEVTLVLWVAGETRRSDARDLSETILNSLDNQLYGMSADLVDPARLSGDVIDQTPDWAEGQGLAVYSISYYQVVRSQAAAGHAFHRRY